MYSKRHLFRRHLLFKHFGTVFPVSENTLILHTHILFTEKTFKIHLEIQFCCMSACSKGWEKGCPLLDLFTVPLPLPRQPPASPTAPKQPHQASFWLQLSKLSLNVCSAVRTSIQKKKGTIPLSWAEKDSLEPSGHEHDIQCASLEHQPTPSTACWTS